MPAFRNPVLPGCHPDPSVCRVGDAYYLVTSTFGYFPGIPVHRSTDLVHWETVGHVLDRPGQLDLAGHDLNDGVWAPTIRHHAGVFYVVSTIASGRRGATTFVATATDAAGPWSDPVALDAEGIDPSLFFDDDGRCWFTAVRDAADPAATGPGELWLRELDVGALRLVGPTHVLWHGAVRGQWVEAPHLYRHGDRYVLLGAEGGTERNHAVTAATADHVTGPYVTDPRSPLLTHRHLGPGHPVQNVGHADLVTGPDGRTWAVVLGVRAVDGVHTLGRETFLVPAAWTDDGLVLAPGAGVVPTAGTVPTTGTVPTDVTALAGEADDRPGDRRGVERLDPTRPLALQGWSSLRAPVGDLVRAEPGAQGLVLTPSATGLADRGTPAFVGRRQQHVVFGFRARVHAVGLTGGEEAGLTLLQHQDRFVTLAATADPAGGGQVVRAVRHDTGGPVVLAEVPLPAGPVVLAVTGDATGYALAAWTDGADAGEPVAHVDRSFLSTEEAGGFLGVHVGLHATGAVGESDARVHVTDVVYTGDNSGAERAASGVPGPGVREPVPAV